MAAPLSVDFYRSLLNTLADGITVYAERRTGGSEGARDGSQAREILYENTQAAKFREQGEDAQCVKVLEREVVLDRDLAAASAGGDIPSPTDEGRQRLVVEVRSNPMESKLLKEVLNAIPELTHIHDRRDGSVAYVSQHWSRITGMPVEEAAAGRHLIHPDDKPAHIVEWAEALRTLKPFIRDFRLLRGAGGDPDDFTWVRSCCGHLRNEFGKALWMVGVTLDQTEAARTRELLAEEKSFLEAALDAVPAGVIVTRKRESDDTIRVMNRETLRMWAKPEAILPGNTVDYTQWVGLRDDGSRMADEEWPLWRSLHRGEVVKGQQNAFLRFDGTRGVLRTSSGPVHHPGSGEIIGAVAASEDITERLAMENERAARLAAEKAAAEMRQLLATVSHEVRTPIAGVIGLASLLCDSPLTADQRELVEGIRDSGQLLLVVISDLLDHCKIAAGKMELEMKPFSLFGVIKHAVSLTREVASAKGLHLVTVFDESLPEFVVHSDLRFKQVLLNLLSNAAKFTPPGGTITIEGRAELLDTAATEDVGANDDITTGESLELTSELSTKQPAGGSGEERRSFGTAASLEEDEVHGEAAGNRRLVSMTRRHSTLSCVSDPRSAPSPLDTSLRRDSARSAAADAPGKLASSDDNSSGSTSTLAESASTDLSLSRETSQASSPVRLARLYFSIRDSGIGLTEPQMQRLFKPFMQADSSTTRKYGGTGLGLALCHDLLKLMGGSIQVESAGEGKGACFHFNFVAEVADFEAQLSGGPYQGGDPQLWQQDCNGQHALSVNAASAGTTGGATASCHGSSKSPRTLSVATAMAQASVPSALMRAQAPTTLGLASKDFAAAESEASAASSSAHAVTTVATASSSMPAASNAVLSSAAPASTPGKQARILIVDDVSVNRSLAKRFLQKLGYTDVAMACDGAEAVEMVRTDERGFDLVLCDLMMPVMGGSEAAAAIKALASPRRRSVPVVAMTAAVTEQERFASSNDFAAWLPKPYDVAELGSVVEQALGGGKQ